MSPKQQALINAYRAQHPALMASYFKPVITSRDASECIEWAKSTCEKRYRHRPGSIRAIVADALVANGMSKHNTFRALLPKLNTEIGYVDPAKGIRYTKRFSFDQNPEVKGGKRIPKAIDIQREELRAVIDHMARTLNMSEIPSFTPQESVQESPVINSEPEEASEASEPEEEIAEDESALHWFLRKIREIRNQEQIRSDTEGKRTPILESVSGNRVAENAAHMIRKGIPVEACLYALSMDWPEEARNRYGISKYDFTSFGERVEGKHPAYAYVRALAECFLEAPEEHPCRLVITLVGPSGTGKSTLMRQIAEDLGLSYGMVPMTAGATPSWIVGAITMDGYKDRPGVRSYCDGGVFVFEEFDASDPNMALVANNMLANGVFDNPVTGQTLKRHRNWIPAACMNTLGLGATATNTGRSRMDDATRNRLAMGRVELFQDENLETEIFESILSA